MSVREEIIREGKLCAYETYLWYMLKLTSEQRSNEVKMNAFKSRLENRMMAIERAHNEMAEMAEKEGLTFEEVKIRRMNELLNKLNEEQQEN